MSKCDLKIGERFKTAHEIECHVVSPPDEDGFFHAYNTEGELCGFNTADVVWSEFGGRDTIYGVKKVLCIFPPGLLEEVDLVAKAEYRNRSDLIREALRRYIHGKVPK